MTGFGMDGVPVDADGRRLYPFISWYDPRTEPQRRRWLELVGEERQFAIGGNPVWTFSTALRLHWMAEHEPAILARTAKWLLIVDFLNFMLSGRAATDFSMASTTLLFDLRRREWSEEILRLSGIDRRLLCDPQPSGTRLGEVTPGAAGRTGLAPGTPVFLGGHDYLCGALPVGGYRPGVILDVTGTWEIVQTTLAEPVLTDAARTSGLTVEAHVVRDRCSAMGGAVAGEALEWVRRTLAPGAEGGAEADWSGLMAEAAASPPGARGVLFLPHLSGAGCPVVDSCSRGAFTGLTPRSTRGDLIRAVVEGLDFQFLDILQAMERGLGARTETIVAVGGAVRNAFWMQNKADVTGRPIEVPEVEEATALGAAILAGIGVGLYRDEADAFARVRRPGRLYEPDPREAPRYAERFAIYRELHPALRGVHHRSTDHG